MINRYYCRNKIEGKTQCLVQCAHCKEYFDELNTDRLIYITANLKTLLNKGACIHTQDKANSCLYILKTQIEKEHYNELFTAHQHYLLGEGAQEFYDVTNRLIEYYNHKFDRLVSSTYKNK